MIQFDRRSMVNRHKLALGLFCTNVSSGRVVSKLPERWHGTWEENQKLAKIADEGGIDFILPLGRWKGYGGETNYQGSSLETITWATGMLAHTKRMTVFGTVHAPLFHPVAAAKQMVTADQIGSGRFGLNIVVGWNEGEFDMFGADMRDHDARYDYAQEWVDVVRRIWTAETAFDFPGKFFKLKGVTGDPRPYGGTLPLIMNAGRSSAGRDFTSRNCDLFFTGVHGELDKWAGAVASAKQQAASVGRSIEVCATASVTCKGTRQEARDFFEYTRSANADWGAIDAMIKSRPVLGKEDTPEEIDRKRKALANGYGTPGFVGNPDDVAAELAKLSSAGIKAIGLDFFNYLDDLPFFIDEVIPRLEKLGLRQPQ